MIGLLWSLYGGRVSLKKGRRTLFAIVIVCMSGVYLYDPVCYCQEQVSVSPWCLCL